MSSPYVGEIRIFGFTRIPVGWFACNGQLVPIAEYDALYALIGTTYGGDGQSTFAVPDLRGRVPVHQGTGPGLTNRTIGEIAGTETVTLTMGQIPAHTHPLVAANRVAVANAPNGGALLGAISGEALYSTEASGNPIAMHSTAISVVGGSQPHDNLMPTIGTNICIAWAGIFPTQG